MAQIELRQLTHTYAKTTEPALQIGDFSWQDGGAYALLGPSGCGKTTLLNIISGLITPSSGKVIFDGVDVTNLDARARNIAQVFQFPVIYDTMSVFDNLAFPLRNRGVAKKQIALRVAEVAESLELSECLDSRASGLSADQKQLISLGRGLVRDDVAAILFDEPLTVIDPHQKFKLRRLLKELHSRFKLTLIYVTHDQSEALTFADQVTVMHGGKAIQTDTPEALYERPSHQFVGHFIGNPGMNFLTVDVVGDQLRLQGHALPLPKNCIDKANASTNAPIIGIRPEYLRVTESIPPEKELTEHRLDPNILTSLPVNLVGVENHGNYYLLEVELNGDTVMVRANQVPSTSKLTLHLPRDRTKLYVNERLVN